MSDNLYTRKGVWYARIQTGGGDLRRSLQTRDEREAKRRLKSFLTTNSVYHGTARRSWEEAVGAWTMATEAHRKPKTWTRYALSLRTLDRSLAGRFLEQIDRAAVLGFIATRKAEGVTVATIRRDLTALSGVMELAVENDWIAANPTRMLPKRQLRGKTPIFVRPPDDAVSAVIGALYGAVMSEFCRFVLATGMRRDEALYLRRSAINLRQRSATLDDTKNGSTRVVTLSDDALAIVKRQPVSFTSPEFLFVSSRGTPFTRATEMMREANMRVAVKAQKKAQPAPAWVTIHDLRHLYAIRHLESGGNLYALQLQLGHGSIRQTEWYLRFLTPESALAAKNAAGTKKGTHA